MFRSTFLRPLTLFLGVPAAFILLAAAQPHPSPATDHQPALWQADDTAELFKAECSSCHGVDGKGQTKAGKRAGVKDFTDAAYQATWTDADAQKVIATATKDGKQLKNKKPFKDKLTAAQISALVQHVRKFAPAKK